MSPIRYPIRSGVRTFLSRIKRGSQYVIVQDPQRVPEPGLSPFVFAFAGCGMIAVLGLVFYDFIRNEKEELFILSSKKGRIGTSGGDGQTG